jgi:adenylate cyclase
MALRLSPPTFDWVKARTYHLLAPFVALALVWLLVPTRVAQLLEDQTINLRFQARAAYDPPADPKLVFVAIDQYSLEQLGAWPWPRNIEADFLKTFVNAGVNPHTVTFDIMFTDDYDKFHNLQSKSGENYDDILGDAAGLLPSVITGAFSIAPLDNPKEEKAADEKTRLELTQPSVTVPLANIHGDISKVTGSNNATLPVRSLRKQSLFGFVNDDPSPIDGIRHTIPLIVRVQDKVFPSLALQVLCQMLNIDSDKVDVNLEARQVTLKNSSDKIWTIPINEKGEFTINYRREDGFTKISFASLFLSLANHVTNNTPLPKECDVTNKVLLIGQQATGSIDLGPTPLQSESPLPYTHLNVINNVLRNDYLKFVPWWWVVIGWAFITWPTLLRLKDAYLGEAVLMPSMVVILYIAFAFLIFGLWSVQIALSWPVISYTVLVSGGVILRWREEQRGREQIKSLFSKMLSPEVMNHLMEHPENVELGGSMRNVTILFSDIRGYTQISENIETNELVRQLNVYFDPMVECVQSTSGTFHKYIGDAIMAAWGDITVTSQGMEKDARNAVSASLAMREKLRELNEKRTVANLLPLRIGIGLNHGEVLAGIIGASSRREFTVMGDPVNVASRLEGMTKEFKTDLAISESVRLLLGDEFLVRRLGLIQLKGKTKPTVVYEVLAEKNALQNSSLSPEMVAQYERAFDHFLTRHFTEAEADFAACEKLYPNDHCVKIYLKACREFVVTPPPPEWDGRFVMETK